MTFNFAMQAIDHIINSAAKAYYMSAGMVRISFVLLLIYYMYCSFIRSYLGFYFLAIGNM